MTAARSIWWLLKTYFNLNAQCIIIVYATLVDRLDVYQWYWWIGEFTFNPKAVKTKNRSFVHYTAVKRLTE